MARPSDPPLPPRLPAELTASDLAAVEDDTELVQAELAGDCSGRSAEDVEMAECRLSGARLTGVCLDRLRLTDTLFEDCELSGAMFDQVSMTRVAFRRCRMSGFVAARGRLHDVHFADCRLDGANFRMVTTERVAFAGCDLHAADFQDAALPFTRFFSCDLGEVELSKAKLGGARLHGSTFEGIKGAAALAGAVVDSTQIMPLALAMMGAFRITVDDEAEPAG